MDYEKLHRDTITKLQEMVNSGKITAEIARGICADFVTESEDERIRKEIILALKFANVKGVYNKHISWLEKQGEHAKFRDSIQVGDKVTRNKDGVLVNLSQLNRVAKPTEEYNITGIGSKNAQGKLGEMISKLKPVNEVLEQKTADKVEPKFREGEWITHNTANFVFKIINVGSNGYEVVNREIYKKTISFDNEDNYHLWTIQDAKNGDILQLGGVTAIFKELIDKSNCRCYCSVYEGEFEIPSQDGIDNSYGCHDATPVTKEQRDNFIKAMYDAGYAFDFEKKELKKIEQKPSEWSKEDEQILNDIIKDLVHPWNEYIPDRIEDEIKWLKKRLKSLKELREE